MPPMDNIKIAFIERTEFWPAALELTRKNGFLLENGLLDRWIELSVANKIKLSFLDFVLRRERGEGNRNNVV